MSENKDTDLINNIPDPPPDQIAGDTYHIPKEPPKETKDETRNDSKE